MKQDTKPTRQAIQISWDMKQDTTRQVLRLLQTIQHLSETRLDMVQVMQQIHLLLEYHLFLNLIQLLTRPSLETVQDLMQPMPPAQTFWDTNLVMVQPTQLCQTF